MATYTIKAGHKLTVSTNALTKGSYFRIGDPDNAQTAPTSFNVSSVTVIGPFTNDQRYQIDSNGAGITVTDAFTDLSGLSVISDLTGVQADFLDDLADDASGAAIATFANAIRDALVAAGIMAEGA